MGKLAQGTNVIKLFPDEDIIESINIPEKQDKDLILLTNKGYFIKHNTKDIRICKKGELGKMILNFKDNKKINNRIINCFINNKYIYVKTNQERYKKIATDQIDNSIYDKEKKLNIELNDNEFIKSTFSIILPENN